MIPQQYLEYFLKDAELKAIFNHIIGETDVSDFILLIEAAIKNCLNTEITKILFLQVSIGAVFGLQLSNDTQVVLKIYSPKISYDYLVRMNEAQMVFLQKAFLRPRF